jgi:hypothetical protein
MSDDESRRHAMERPIDAGTTIGVAFARARDVLLDDPGSVFTDGYTTEERRARRFRMELSIPLRGGASVHQGVVVQLGVARSVDSGLVQPLTWYARAHQWLLPAFDGALEVSEVRQGAGLRLVGRYTVPLGAVGQICDAVLGHWLARRSIEMLVETFGRRLDREAEGRLKNPDGNVPPRHLTTAENERSESYVA